MNLLARLVCGRCGQFTNDNSTYCPRDRWALLADLPGNESRASTQIEFELPPMGGGFLARRRQEGHRDQLEKTYRAALERRLEALEKRLQHEPDNAEVMRAMGLMALLENHLERANALLERAHQIDSKDFETSINFAITLTRRGQVQPALNVLMEARKLWPNAPLLYYNMALVALQARRPALVHEAVAGLEKLWQDNPAIAQDFHDEAVTARGLAFLLENNPKEALRELDAAARHLVRHKGQRVERLGGEDDEDVLEVTYEQAGEDVQLEGKTAEADGLNNLALAEAAQGDLDQAIQRLKAAIRLEPGHPQVLNNLGVLAYRQGRLQVAYKFLDLARQVEESLTGAVEPATHNHLGVVLSAMGKLDEGLEHFESAGSSERAEFEVFYNLGRAFIEHGKPDKGVEYLRHAFAVEPNNADVHTVLGAAYLLRGRTQLYAEALKHLKRALQIDPHHRIAALDLSLALMEIRNPEAAAKIISQGRKLFKDEAGVWFIQGLLTLENPPSDDSNHWATAAAYFDKSMDLRPDITAALYNSALCQFIMGFRDTSSQLLQAAINRDGSIGPAYYLIGFGHAVAKRFDEAQQAWQIAAQYEPNNADVHANLGALQYRKGNFAGASRSYMNAHRLLPDDSNILAALGVAFAQQKMYNQAVTALQQSITLDPRSAMAHSNLGLAHYLFKQVEQAMQHWRLVSTLDSKYAASREEEQQRSFDDSVVQLRPVEWRSRVIHMAPVLPRPQTRLLAGTNAHAFRPAITDPALQEIVLQKREVEKASRMLAWMNLKT